MKYRPLDLKLYQAKTLTLAEPFLGKLIVRNDCGVEMVSRIMELEAYLPDDPACHASRGKTKRNESMFMGGGTAYVYLVYGMYHCFNIVTEPEGVPAALLIRAALPLVGIRQMLKNRGITDPKNVSSGPGKLCMAMNIGKSLDGIPLNSKELFITDDGFKVPKNEIQRTTRIGISKNTEKKWRFLIRQKK